MIKLVFVFFTIAFSLSVYSAEIGFKNGNNRTAQLIEGDITVQCFGSSPGSPNSGFYNCRRDILNPSETDYFQGPAGVDADSVVLVATHEDGSKRTKDDDYISTKSRSDGRFNLWIATLFQRPLLDGGKNTIHYALKKKNNIVSQGDFTVLVNDGGRKYCSRRGYYTSSDSHDCEFPDRFCDQYFEENNYCQ